MTHDRIHTAIAAASHGGAHLSVDDVLALVTATGDDLETLLTAASALRDDGLELAGRAGIITYSRKVFVPLTTLCRDRCHYCIFVDTPGQLLKKQKPVYMSAEQVLTVVRKGAAMGCKEALLTLGDRPEDRWPEARAWLDEHGYASTLDYVADMARIITAETGMLAHLNPGVMSAHELRMLRPTGPSMGMMLETTSREIFETPGQPHYGSPDKDPALRLQVIEDAGRERVPFTTGILVGIGETPRDRAESLLALRDAHARHGHVQEVIVQNFRAKPRTAMQDAADADLLEYAAVVAAARIVMGARMRIQVPPNLSDPAEFELLVRAGIDDWGGVSPLTADHVNPERPWPHLDDLAARTAELGYELRERLTAHPEYVHDADTWIDPALHAAVARLADPDTGLARSAAPEALPERRRTSTGSVRELAERAASDPLAIEDAEWVRMLTATEAELDAVIAVANDLRRYTVGEAISIVSNRNVTSTGFRRAGATTEAEFDLDDARAIALDAVDLGATEICVQGLVPASESPGSYLDMVRTMRDAAPDLHLHAYRPQDMQDLASRAGMPLSDVLQAMRDAGVNTVPGTGVKVLSERVRRLIAPTDLDIDAWVETITAAHRAGFGSTSVLFYGHVETAEERIAHLRELRRIQADTGGFNEFVPIPLPGPAGGVPLVPGRSALDEHRAMVAIARLALSGSIAHVQIPWTRHGVDTAALLLGSGGDDLGGTLLNGRVKPLAGVEHEHELSLTVAARIAGKLFRPLRQRTTDYLEPSRV